MAPPNTDTAVLEDWRAAFDATVGSRGLPQGSEDAGHADRADVRRGTRQTASARSLSDEERLRADLSSAFTCGKSLVEGVAGACHQS